MKKVLVIGAAGVLGRMICQEIRRIWQEDIHLIVSDYRIDRGKQLAESLNANYCYADATEKESIQKAVRNVECVIVVLKQKEPIIQRVCIENGVHCMDVTPFSKFINQVDALHESACKKGVCSIVMSGFFPGLSGLIVKKAVNDFENVMDVHVGLLQNTNAQAGITGIIDMLRIISKSVSENEQSSFPGFKKKRKLPFGYAFTMRSVRAIHHDEKEYIIKRLGVRNVNYWTSWNQAIFNAFISFSIRTGIVHKIIRLKNPRVLSHFVKHNRLKEEVAYLTVEATGITAGARKKRILTLTTPSDYRLTAMVTAALIKNIDNRHSGVVLPFEMTDADDVLTTIQSDEITLIEHYK